MSQYNFREIEKKWQQHWKAQNSYKVENNTNKPKYYILDMFPYPSGAGLHVGHPLGYIASDILARFKRLKGYNVLHPMGFDSFGLPAEQYAIETGRHPAETTAENAAMYRRQLDNIGFSFDWDRCVSTSEPNYYKWTQWIFGLFYNSWYNKSTQKAEDIQELIAHFEQKGSLELNAACDEDAISFTANDWAIFSKKQQSDVLMQYRLAFLKDTIVNWCPKLGTVLANEEVIDGKSERGGYPVERKLMRQWCMRITAYADRLLDGLDSLEWSDSVKEMQRNWIGKSTGASLRFKVDGIENIEIEVFTTRPDTSYGVTFLSIAPEHELVKHLTTAAQTEEVEAYVAKASAKTELERMSNVKLVSGAFTGSYAINPYNGARVPIYVADYVLAGYGTGAVMAVPCSDTRDYAFANHFQLPIIKVQEGDKTDIALPDFDPKAGTLINSDALNGLTVSEAVAKAIEIAEQKGFGKGKTNYRQRDAIFSRQRYWGEPFPIAYDEEGIEQLLPFDELPLTLPEIDKLAATEDGEPPLARAKNWVDKRGHRLETNTMPGWAGSSWYFFRYMDAQNSEAFASKEALEYWKEVDLYLGGSEHTTGHLFYARFWTKFLYDKGFVSIQEPFKKLVNQGMIQGQSQKAYVLYFLSSSFGHIEGVNTALDQTMVLFSQSLADDDAKLKAVQKINKEALLSEQLGNAYPLNIPVYYTDGTTVRAEKTLPIFNGENAIYLCETGYYINGEWRAFEEGAAAETFKTFMEVEKMSKSKRNVINPDDIIEEYGADTFRMYEMFLGPLQLSKPWDTKGISGTYNFLRKVWRLFFNDNGELQITDDAPSAESLKALHKLLKKLESDIESLSFNTCVSAFMIAVNELTAQKCKSKEILQSIVIALSPFAPHIAEELWQVSGGEGSVLLASFPKYEERYTIDDVFNCPIQINGKLKVSIELALNLQEEEVKSIVLNNEAVQKALEGKAIKKFIVVPNRIVNIVVG